MRDAACSPSNLVDLNNVAELNYVREDSGYICIGATATHAQVASSPIAAKAPALVDAVSGIGSPQVRNRATIAGNLCNASPAADSAPPLLVHEAEVAIRSLKGTRIIPLEELFAAPKLNTLEPDELVTEVRLPAPPEGDRKSTRLNSSHGYISYAVFCLKKKKTASNMRTKASMHEEQGSTVRHRDAR